jgi:hypothetical protein
MQTYALTITVSAGLLGAMIAWFFWKF